MFPWIKFLHLIFAVTLFGLCISSVYYVRSASQALYPHAIKESLKLDRWIILPFMLLTFIFGTGMVHGTHLSLHVHWVLNAYIFLSINLILWSISAWLRWKKPERKNLYLIFQILVLVIFVIILHDAVTQSTWF